MSEQFPANHEQHEAIKLDLEHELPTAQQAEALRPGEADPAQKLEHARSAAEETASEKNPIEQLQASEKAATPAEPQHINQELKSITLRRELQQIRRKLPRGQRVLSSIIHQPAVRAASEVTGKTISRPSGMLGGGLVALIGSSGYLYVARHMGFKYNYFVFTALFIGGFAIGLILELIVWAITSPRRHAAE